MDDKRRNLRAQSLLVPAYGFDSAGEARVYLQTASGHQLNYSCPAVVYGEKNRRHYVTIPGYWFETSTDILRATQVRGAEEEVNKFQIDLRKQDGLGLVDPICLLASGHLRFNCQMDTSGLPGWVMRLTNGQRSCYACWQQADGSPFSKLATITPKGGPIILHAARSGRGGVYARTAILDQRGHLAGYLVIRVRLEFQLLKDNLGDLLELKIGRTVTREGLDESPSANGLALEGQWKYLMSQAQQGFMKGNGEYLPREVDVERRLIIDQITKFRKDAEMAQGSRFRDLVDTLPWQDVLRMVSEPWQLEVVRRVHLQSAAPCRTLLDMLLEHDCQDERREELRKMALALVDLQDCF
ncbi:MAG: hypothetical protein PHC53_03315 [Patescibacteria group bacterium]|nr:hypothetical protein [Patescibacteria group bacterium]